MIMRINDLPVQLKPREKAKMYGIDYLTNVELLAIIIGNGVVGSSALEISADIISEYDSLQSLTKAKLKDLQNIYGLNDAKALQVLAAFALAGRIEAEKSMSKNVAFSGKDLYDKFKLYFDAKSKEELVVVSISNKGMIKKCNAIAKGNEAKILTSPKEIINEVIASGQNNFYLIHNHVGEDATPSESDISLTMSIREECKSEKINFLDHIIISKDSYYSFKENNI